MAVSVSIGSDDDRVAIAVDQLKASWTAAAVGATLEPLAITRVPVSRKGYPATAHPWTWCLFTVRAQLADDCP